MGAVEVASSAVQAMKSTPLAIALLVVNIAFLAFAAYVLGEVATNAGERNKSQLELIGNLIRECRQGPQSVVPKLQFLDLSHHSWETKP